MNVTVKNGKLMGEVTVPSSKSVAHRMIIASVLSGSRSSIFGSLNSKDIIATLDCMSTLGATINECQNGVEIEASNLTPYGKVFNVNESGSTMRFLLPLLPAYLSEFSMVGEGRIGERPVSALRKAMGKCGVEVDKDFLPVSVKGRYCSNHFSVNAGVSSQFVTGLLFTLVALGGGTLKIEGELTSKGYIDITIGVLEKYGVSVSFEDNIYTVSLPNGMVAPREIRVNGDWSSACFWIVAGVLNGDITIKGLEYPDHQPDSIILSLIKEMGGKVTCNQGAVRAMKSDLKAIEFDADGSPDIVPILAVACSCAEGVSTITGTRRLRLKESDRVKAVTDMLSACGVKVESGENHIKIWGTNNIKGGVIDSVRDHRIAMSGIILGSVSSGDVTVKEVECVSKSYPDFLKDFALLGGKYE